MWSKETKQAVKDLNSGIVVEKRINFCPYCGKTIEYAPFDGGQASFLEPWCRDCQIGIHRGLFKKSLLSYFDLNHCEYKENEK